MAQSTQPCRFAGGCLSSPNRSRFGFFVFLPRGAAALALLALGSLNSSRAEERDSLRLYRLDSLIVTASRAPFHAPVFAMARDIPLPVPRGELSLAHALSMQPGLQVREYGGAGALATASFHGMDPGETVVLLDGVRMNGLQHGMVDLNKIPLAGLASATIASADISFDDAAGSTISLHGGDPARGVAVVASAGVGDFGESAGSLSVASGSQSMWGSIHAAVTHATNDFPYLVGDQRRTRLNADFTMRSVLARGAWQTGEPERDVGDATRDGPRHEILLTAIDADEGVPGSIVSNTGAARQHDRQVIGQLRSHWIDDASAHLESAVSYNYADETYSDTALNLGGSSFNSNSVTRSLALSARGIVSVTSGLMLHAGLRETFANASSVDLLHASRFETQALAGPELTLTPTGLFESVRIQLLGRIDIASDAVADRGNTVRTLPTVSLGASAIPFGSADVLIRAYAGTTGRLPTFNDLYWNPGGNPNLRTEHAVKGELGGRGVVHVAGLVTIDGAVYYVDARDKIVWQPVSGALWSPRNLRHVQSTGATATVSWSPALWLSARGSIDYGSHRKIGADFPGDNSAGKQLLYVPQETASAGVTIAPLGDQLTLDAQMAFASFRYTTSDNTRFLPSYTVLDLELVGRVTISSITLRPALRCTNVTNNSYNILEGYPLPLRAFHLSINTEFNAD